MRIPLAEIGEWLNGLFDEITFLRLREAAPCASLHLLEVIKR
jgi:hypothetical protein